MAVDIATMERDAQRALAIKALLARPLIGRGDEAFTAIALHEDWIQEWFSTTCGWILHPDARHGFFRLKKVTEPGDTTRPALRGNGFDAPAFTARGYVVLCLLAAALGEHPRPRISLKEIAERVSDAAILAKVAAFTPDSHRTERRALIQAIGLLERLEVVRELDRHGEDYVADKTTNVLYRIDERRLALLIAAPSPPTRSADWREMVADHHSFEDAEAGEPRALQHAMRRLLDDAVCYLDDLTPVQGDALHRNQATVKRRLTEAGLELEVRAEYWVALDTEATGNRRTFPRDTIPANAALLILDHLTRDGDRPRGLTEKDAVDFITGLMDAHPKWAKSHRAEPAKLTEQALTHLVNLNLVRRTDSVITARPAARRWRVRLEAEPAPAPAPAPADAPGEQEPLFAEED
ncbi:MAG TPA: TIGR02678 family protein [Actinospica sp.]|nr:TIGR02678 family protein [Actinospica sp.]